MEDDVQAITHRFSHRWVWRDTPLEYAAPGYRQGPLLVLLDEPLFDHALDNWLTRRAGLVLQGPDDGDVLLQHLQPLHQLIAADGFPVGFSLHAARELEELCEALPDDQRAALFGPIQSMLWHTGDSQYGQWLGADRPAIAGALSTASGGIALTPGDEAALDRASYAWFMRDCVSEFTRKFPEYAQAENQPLLRQHLSLFYDEAERFGIQYERDVRDYMTLRLRYPQRHFANDESVRATLFNVSIAAMQRLFAIEERLRQLGTTASEGAPR